MKQLPSQEKLLERFSYNPETGVLTYNKHYYKSYNGRVAGSITKKGYVSVNYDGKKYKAHRIIWMMMTGEDPGELTIDHADRHKANNIWTNLRLATGSQQEHNKDHKGVQETPWGWSVRIMANGIRRTVGTFKTKSEALRMYQEHCVLRDKEFAPV
jgi:hypothetical protein